MASSSSYEVEEAESLVSSSVGKGGKRFGPPSMIDQVAKAACEPKIRKKLLTGGFIVAMLLLIVAANSGGSSDSTAKPVDLQEEGKLTFVDTMPPENVIPAVVAKPATSGIVIEGPQEGQQVTIDVATPEPAPKDPPAVEVPKEEVKAEVMEPPKETPVEQPKEVKAEVTEPQKETPADEPKQEVKAPKEATAEQSKEEAKVEVTEPPKDAPVDEAKDEVKAEETPKVEEKPKEEPPKKKASKIPLVEEDIQTGRSDEKQREAESEKWGSWHFWDGDVGMRPKEDYVGVYPNRDVPGDKFPDTSWQVDAVFVNHYLNDADKLIQRAMEAIFTEYGHGKPLPPEKMAERHKMFHWEKLDFSKSQDPPEQFTKKGSRDIGGWTTKRSFDGLVRRLLHAMLTQDTFTVVLAGHSAAQGQGNHFRQSYIMQFHRIMKPIFERLGVKLITRNISFGGMGTVHSAMGSRDILGKEIDLILWDSGMTENGNQPHIDLFMRQALIAGNRVPIIWGAGNWDLLKLFHETVDADVGEFGNGFAGIEAVRDEAHALEIPWAARFIKCVDERAELCKDDRFAATCWIDREDGIHPEEGQKVRLDGQVRWHPGWRVHQLQGRVLAFAVLEGLEVAVNRWMEGTMTGQPLDDDYWHVTDYYENIRNKVKNLDPSVGECYRINGTLPVRLCNTPMNGRTQYTPRADYDESSLTSIIKPADNGYIPKNLLMPLYEGPDVHNPNFDVPEGEIDVASIVANRRKLTARHPVDVLMDSITPPNVNEHVNILREHSKSRPGRQLDETITPGKGWEISDEPQGLCDGTYEGQCGRSTNNNCFLNGHHCSRGAVIGNEFSGWLVMTLKDLRVGIIVLKLHTWHYPQEQLMTASWNSVNGERRRLGGLKRAFSNAKSEHLYVASDTSLIEANSTEDDKHRSLKMRSYETPELPDTFMFDYAVNGKITSLNGTEFMALKHEVSRIVETWTLLDDPEFTNDPQDVEVAIRLRGSGRQLVFGVTHIYWA